MLINKTGRRLQFFLLFVCRGCCSIIFDYRKKDCAVYHAEHEISNRLNKQMLMRSSKAGSVRSKIVTRSKSDSNHPALLKNQRILMVKFYLMIEAST